MRGVAEQGDVALGPVLHRLAVAQHPHLPGVDAFQHAQHFRALAVEMLPEQFLAAFRVPALLILVGVEYGDEVVDFAAAHRIVHEMRARTGPQDHVRVPQIVRHLVAAQHRPIGDMPGDARLAVADDPLADFRPHAVAGDERAAGNAAAADMRDHAGVAAILVVVDVGVGFERDEIVILARLEEGAVDIGPVRHRIRIAECLHHLVAEADIGDQLAGERVPHLQVAGDMRVGEHGVLEPDLVEHAEDIGAELDAGADFLEFGRLLEQMDRHAFQGQRVSCRQAADAAAGYDDRFIRSALRHLMVLRRLSLHP